MTYVLTQYSGWLAAPLDTHWPKRPFMQEREREREGQTTNVPSGEGTGKRKD